MRKAAVALVCLLFRTMPLASSEVIFERTYVVPRVFGGSESIRVDLMTGNDPAVVQPNPADSTRIQVYTRSNTALTVSKYEESGGYAHGIDWWVNGVNQPRLLYAFSRNGAASLGTFPSGTTIELRLYRINVIFYEAIDPLYRIVTTRDASGPSFELSPTPGGYPSVVVTAAPTDGGVGMADPALATTFTVARASTGEIVTAGSGTRVEIEEEGAWNVSFSAADLLGNVGSCPAGTSPPNTYLVDRSPPVLSDVVSSLRPRLDGALDFDLAFTLGDAVSGVALPTLSVAVACEVDGVLQWTLVLGESDLHIEPDGLGCAVNLPTLVVPRSAILRLELAAADAIGNALDPGAGSITRALPPAALHASILTREVTAEAELEGLLLVARYRVPLALDRPRETLRSDGVARYRLTRTIQATGEVEIVVDMAPAAFADLLVDRDGLAVFTDTMEGGHYAHQSISYAIETVFAASGSESVIADGIATMPNIEAWQVRVTSGEKFLQTYSSYDLTFPVLPVRSVAGMVAGIGPDPEGDALGMRLQVEGPEGFTATWPPTGWASSITFSNALPEVPIGVYRARFVISELGNDQLMISDWCTIVVDPNYGEIDGDVVWTTDQTMSGSIIVYPGASLTIGPGVRVTVARGTDPATGAGLSITIRSGGTLVLSPGSVVQPVDWGATTRAGEGWEYWAGIEVEGTATISGGVLRGAARGIAALPGSDVTLQGARLEACRTGVHAFGAGVEPAIDGTWFVRCARYGIKEDAGAAPVVIDCVFERNTSDYYDTALTVVRAEEIDELAPGRNHGNRSTGGTP